MNSDDHNSNSLSEQKAASVEDDGLSALERRILAKSKEMGLVDEKAELAKAQSFFDQYGTGLEDLENDPKSGYRESEVDKAIKTIGIKEVYNKLPNPKYDRRHGQREGEGIRVSCPWPEHADDDPSAWLHTTKTNTRGESGFFYCGGCAEGGDLNDMLGILYNFHNAKGKQFHNIRKLAALEFRGVKDEPRQRQAPVVEVADEIEPAVEPAAVIEVAEVESLYPTYRLSDVLPGTDTYLDRYCTEGLKAEVPREFPFWGGLSALSMALGRTLAYKHIPEYATYGNLLICLVCPPGTGKGRTMGSATSMVEKALPHDKAPMLGGEAPTGARVMGVPGSAEFLIKELDEPVLGPTPSGGTASVIKRYSSPTLLHSEELQLFIGKSGGLSSYKSYMIEFADGKSKITAGSLTTGYKEMHNGFVSFITATQNDHLRDQFTNRDGGSGFLSRFIFPFANPVKKTAFPVASQDWRATVDALSGIRKWIDGLEKNNDDGDGHWISREDWDDDARAMYQEFFDARIEPDSRGEHAKLLTRLEVNILRLMLLFAANEMSERFTVGIVRRALALYDYMRSCTLNLAREAQNTEMSDNMQIFLDAVKKLEEKNEKPATIGQIRNRSAVGTWNPEQLANTTSKLMRAKMVFFVKTKSKKGTGRAGDAWTTDLSQWLDHPTLVVTPGDPTT